MNPGFSRVAEGAMRALRLIKLAKSAEKDKFRLYEMKFFNLLIIILI